MFCSSASAVNRSAKPIVFNEATLFAIEDPKLRYSNNKHAAEKLCLDAVSEGQHVGIVNPGEVYGPQDTAFIIAGNLVDFAKSKPVFVCHGGTSIVYVEDVVVGIVRAMEKGRLGERYILSGQNLTVRELAELTLKRLGVKRKVVTLPTGPLRVLTRVATALHVPLPYNPNVVPYATRYWFMNSGKASRELGITFRPAEEVLAPTLAWLKETICIK